MVLQRCCILYFYSYNWQFKAVFSSNPNQRWATISITTFVIVIYRSFL